MFENKQIIASFAEPQPMKQVSYHNHLLYVPISTRYIATNANGDIYAFSGRKPIFVAVAWTPDSAVMVGSFDSAVSLADAEASLVEYKYYLIPSSAYLDTQPREIDYYGMKINLVRRFAWLAFDYNGAVYAYTAEPVWDEQYTKWAPSVDDVGCLFVGTIDITNLRGAPQSLMYVGDKE